MKILTLSQLVKAVEHVTLWTADNGAAIRSRG
jgi:hypothetical protein